MAAAAGGVFTSTRDTNLKSKILPFADEWKHQVVAAMRGGDLPMRSNPGLGGCHHHHRSGRERTGGIALVTGLLLMSEVPHGRLLPMDQRCRLVVSPVVRLCSWFFVEAGRRKERERDDNVCDG
ncbi:hypothetical protein R6Q59_029782 [Mikania micrantha]